MKLKLLDLARHRNGVGGEPFCVVRFRCDGDDMIATVFDAPWHTAVLSLSKLAEGVIAFAENSYRGDEFEPWLRKKIAAPSANG